MKENTAAVKAQVPVDVATFLLNEKRSDVQALEFRHKVQVLLIPSIHLETPQQVMVRIRHDELGQEDQQTPSYRMVDMPADTVSSDVSATVDARSARPEAAIKGITAAQPAPLVADRSSSESEQAATPGSRFLSRILSWFRRKPEAAAAPVADVPPLRRAAPQRDTRRSGPRPARRDEARDSGETRSEREPSATSKPAAAPAPARSEAPRPRPSRDPRPPREAGEARRQRPAGTSERRAPPLEAAAEPALAVTVIRPAPGEARPEGEEATSNGRRRGRRSGRRERTERPDAQAELPLVQVAAPTTTAGNDEIGNQHRTTAADIVATAATAMDAAMPPAADESPTCIAAQQPLTGGDAAPVAGGNEPEAIEIERTPTLLDDAAPAGEAGAPSVPLPGESPAEPSSAAGDDLLTTGAVIADKAQLTLETDSAAAASLAIRQAFASSGLVMVETNPERTQVLRHEPPEEVPPRRRRTSVSVADAPVILVETRK